MNNKPQTPNTSPANVHSEFLALVRGCSWIRVEGLRSSGPRNPSNNVNLNVKTLNLKH